MQQQTYLNSMQSQYQNISDAASVSGQHRLAAG